jgi:hypothetical protein
MLGRAGADVVDAVDRVASDAVDVGASISASSKVVGSPCSLR